MSDGQMYAVTDHNSEKELYADGVNGMYMGKSKIRFGSRKQTYKKPHISSSMYYHKYKDTFDSYNLNVDRCVIIDGCYDTNVQTLRRTINPEVKGKHSSKPSYKFIKNVLSPTIRVAFRKLKFIPSLPRLDINSMLYCRVSGNTKPGFRYEELEIKRTKREAISSAYALARKRWNVLDNTSVSELTHNKLIPGVYTIGARNKRDHDYTDDDLAVSRAVHMPEFHALLTSSPWSDTVVDFIKNVKKGPIYIGNNLLDWFRLNKDMKESSFVFEGDWKRFDSTLYANMITAAVAVWRCLYDLEDATIDQHFIGIYDSLILKDYYIPGGKVFRIFHGLPSGVKETSLLGSIINLIAQIFCIGPETAKKFNFIVGGDDFLTVCKDFKLDANSLKERFIKRAKHLGMEIKFLEIKKHESDKIDDCPVFYKYTIWKKGPIVPPQAVLERVFMPWNKNYDNLVKIYKFLWDVMPSLGKPMSHLYIYYDYLSKMLFLA
jgi:hypothetical protein